MKFKLVLIMLFFGVCTNAQDMNNKEFVESFSKVIIDIVGEEKKEHDISVTFVFNYGNNNDVKMYYGDKETKIYKSISNVKEGKLDDGSKYQYIQLLSEYGDEISLILYSNGNLLLIMYNSIGEIEGTFQFIP